MDIFASLLHGFATAISPVNLLWAFVGCVLGTAVGVLPGIGLAIAAPVYWMFTKLLAINLPGLTSTGWI